MANDYWRYSGPPPQGQGPLLSNNADESAQIALDLTRSPAMLPAGYVPPAPPDLDPKKPAPKSVSSPKAKAKPALQTAPDNTPPEEEIPVEAPPQMRDFSSDVAAARQAAGQDQLASTLWRGVESVSEAFTGRPNHKVSDGMAERAGGHMKTVGENRQMEEMALRARAFNDANDPNSGSNRQFRAMAAKLYPDLAKAANFHQMTQPKLEKVMGFSMDVRKQNATELHNKRQDDAAWVTANRVSAAVGKEDAINGRLVHRDLKDYAKWASKDLSPLIQSLNNIDRLAPGTSDGKVTKQYPLDSWDRAARAIKAGVGENALSPEELGIWKAQREFVDLIARARSGAVLNVPELDEYMDRYSVKMFSSPQGFAESAKQFKALLYRKAKDYGQYLGDGSGGSQFNVEESLRKGGVSHYKQPFFNGVRDEGESPFEPLAPQAAQPQTAAPKANPSKASATDRKQLSTGKWVRRDPATGQWGPE